MLVLEQRVRARHQARGVSLKARLVHGVEAQGWRMQFALIRADVEIDADFETYNELARKLRSENVHVRPARRRLLQIVAPKSVGSPQQGNKSPLSQPAIMPPSNQMKPMYCQDGSEMKDNTPSCHSPGAILPDLPQSAQADDIEKGLSKESSSAETQAWLARHRFHHHSNTFANFSGADLLRLSRDDIIQICGLADGIRLFNALHAKRIEPRLTIYVCPVGQSIYSALYLHACRAQELLQKLKILTVPNNGKDCDSVVVLGPGGTRVRLTDELLRHLPDHAAFTLDFAGAEAPSALLLRPAD